MRIVLFLVMVVVSAVMIIFLTVISARIFRDRNLDRMTSMVSEYAVKLSNQIISTGYLANTAAPQLAAELSATADIIEGRIVVVDANFKVASDTYGFATGKTLLLKSVIEGMRGIQGTSIRWDKKYIEQSFPIRQGSDEILGVILVRSGLERTIEGFQSVYYKLFVVDIILLCVMVLISSFVSGHMTKPFKQIISSIHHISEGYMEDDVSIHGFYEVEQISDSINEMLRRMKKLEESRQEFVSNVSHELKTPMTSIKVLADSLMLEENAPAELYKEFLVDITAEIERENKIITDLLELVKLDRKSGDMHIAQVDINEFLEIILKRVKPIAQQKNIELFFESFRPVMAEVDEVKLSLAISNLVENAVKYNVEGGYVRVSLNADHRYFYITVADSGIGIPESAQDYIFDRFYRVDKARSRETGGTGLGLAITKSVVLRHKGSVRVYSRENEGTTFTVRIPLTYISA